MCLHKKSAESELMFFLADFSGLLLSWRSLRASWFRFVSLWLRWLIVNEVLYSRDVTLTDSFSYRSYRLVVNNDYHA